uniref:Transmembrane protein n=1 Tax=Ralstonia solanacearum TaxID=305 RepID=A0A0S4WDI0_RALSL|nr:protein of unknown function [Ralstonia solanacearum]
MINVDRDIGFQAVFTCADPFVPVVLIVYAEYLAFWVILTGIIIV